MKSKYNALSPTVSEKSITTEISRPTEGISGVTYYPRILLLENTTDQPVHIKLIAEDEATDYAANPADYAYFPLKAGQEYAFNELKGNNTLYYKVLSGIGSGDFRAKRMDFVGTKDA